MADHLIGHFVDQARRSGASWTDIGRGMGVTKQAAQKRFIAKDLDAEEGFSRFTARARNVVVTAAEKTMDLTFREALRLGHNHVGTEHILLAVLELEDGSGPHVGHVRAPDLSPLRSPR